MYNCIVRCAIISATLLVCGVRATEIHNRTERTTVEVHRKPMDELSTPETVELYIYDLSKGLASSLSSMILGKHIEGIWHTSIVIFDKEYYFGQTGISVCEPGSTNAGKPNKVLKLGETHVGEGLFNEYLNGLKQSRFANGTYDLFKHNCNTFTNEVSQFLTSKGIPEDILSLPDEILRSASAWLGHVHSFRDVSPDFETLNNDIDAIRKSKQD